MTHPPALEVQQVHVTLGGTPVLQGVTLSVPRGELVALIGPNGSGKTTLLRAILGLQSIDSGQIRILGAPVSVSSLARVGYVPQKLELDRGFGLSVREFLALSLPETRHWLWQSHRKIDSALASSLEGLGVMPLLNRPVSRLSGGQLQRVLIAWSLQRKPELLLLDEPTAGVDTPGERSFYEMIESVHRRHKMTIILVSHDLSMVFRHAHWVFALNGVVCCQGTPEDIVRNDSLKQAYGLHLTPYHHHHTGETSHVH